MLEGDHVAAGEVLVRLDATDARLAAAERQADVVQAQAELTSLQLDLSVEGRLAGVRNLVARAREAHRAVEEI